MDQAPDNTNDPSADFDIFKSFFDISLSHVDDDWTEIVQSA